MSSPSKPRPAEDRRGQILQEVTSSQFVTVAALAPSSLTSPRFRSDGTWNSLNRPD